MELTLAHLSLLALLCHMHLTGLLNLLSGWDRLSILQLMILRRLLHTLPLWCLLSRLELLPLLRRLLRLLSSLVRRVVLLIRILNRRRR